MIFLWASVRILESPSLFFHKRPWNFYYFIKRNCHFCSDFEPTLRNIAERFESSKILNFAKIDCNRYVKFCIKHRIYGVPSMMLYNSSTGSSFKYNGIRNEENIVNFIESNSNIVADKRFVVPFDYINFSGIIHRVEEGKCIGVVITDGYHYKNYVQILENLKEKPQFEAYMINIMHDFKFMFSHVIERLPSIAVFSMGQSLILNQRDSDKNIQTKINNFCYGKEREKLRIFIKEIISNKPKLSIPPTFVIDNLTEFSEFVHDVWEMNNDEIAHLIDELIQLVHEAQAYESTKYPIRNKIFASELIYEIRNANLFNPV